MTDRPIMFSAPMVRALIAGTKTQTRRLATSPLARAEVGDRLWVREAWSIASIFTDVAEVRYRASARAGYTEFVEQVPVDLIGTAKATWPQYRPGIHMPRWASRLTLFVAGVRTEPLQSISEDDALAEGIDRIEFPDRGDWGWPQRRYRDLWQALHDKDGQRWEDNPEVLVLTFRVERGNIDRVAP